jgi:hypothetical protein
MGDKEKSEHKYTTNLNVLNNFYPTGPIFANISLRPISNSVTNTRQERIANDKHFFSLVQFVSYRENETL